MHRHLWILRTLMVSLMLLGFPREKEIEATEPAALPETSSDEWGYQSKDLSNLVEQHEAVLDAPQQGQDTLVTARPPEDIAENVDTSSAPSQTATWAKGYWRWDASDNEYVWIPGLWCEPPPNMVWYNGSWEKTEAGWRRIPGYWGDPNQAAPEVVAQEPPPPQEEVPPPAPGPDYVWGPGSWMWDGGAYVWNAGQWYYPPYPGYLWVPPIWTMVYGGYMHIPGRWDHHMHARPYRRPSTVPPPYWLAHGPLGRPGHPVGHPVGHPPGHIAPHPAGPGAPGMHPHPYAGPHAQHPAPGRPYGGSPSYKAGSGPSYKAGSGPSYKVGSGPSYRAGSGPSYRAGSGPSYRAGSGPSYRAGNGPSYRGGAGPSYRGGGGLPSGPSRR